ncbi:hypothetical protein [Saccharothrix syringae]|uniref:DUF8017 domain-containing protein n=1 Tax=Saccharothrix syringae TaxID=103733 RepID=A0A5Q0H8X2_SACSY|nr:hypothetical protein [Saccharothrix syringae]QFZ22661.1 hypothetical protein EKG83_39210 [Saccharothrix syringae]
MSYTGLGAYPPQLPPRRPSRAPLWIALAVVAVLAAVVGVVAFTLLGDHEGQAGTPAPTSTSPAPDWLAVEDDEAGLRYELPPSWEEGGTGALGRLRITGSHVSRPFQCQGRDMVQAQAVAGSVASGNAEEIATDVVNRLARGGYTVDGTAPGIGEPRVETSDDRVVVSVEVTPKAVNACYAPGAVVTAVALRKGSKTAVFALNVAQGGPHAAQGPAEDDVRRILEGVRLT